jgi:cystathionine beta-lyase
VRHANPAPDARYNFDAPIDRRGTASLKWDFTRRYTGLEGPLLPLWVADMDFPAPVEVVQALRRRAQHGIYGYTLEPESYFEAAMAWLERRHGWAVDRPWLVPCPGVVPAINLALLAWSESGDGVVIQPPVYYPFKESIQQNGRRVVENPLRLDTPASAGRYRMDLEALERQIDDRTRLLVLCSPHNPVARVWQRDELEPLVELCRRRGLVLVSDEIHHDLVMPAHRHLPTASVNSDAAQITVTLTSATKTFNLAGLGGSLAIIPDRTLRRRFRAVRDSLWTDIANAFAVVAAEAAWRHGEPWLEQVLAYVWGNYRHLVDFLADRLPAARICPLEGTYLAWVDLRGLGYSDSELRERILRRAGVWLDDGPMFGTGGEGFQRINLACPRATLTEALQRMANALAGG